VTFLRLSEWPPTPPLPASSDTPKPYAGPLQQPEAYALFDAFITTISHHDQMYICTSTAEVSFDRFPAKTPADWLPVVDDVFDVNSSLWSLDAGWTLPPWLTRRDDFSIKHDLGLSNPIQFALYFSAPGFNPAKTRALFYYAFVCSGTCGSGGWIAYEKSSGRWRRATVEGWNLPGWVS
jgi:hypothetical protein